MKNEERVCLYTIYDKPRDFPGKFVVRRWFVEGGTTVPDSLPWFIGYTLQAARASVPPGLVYMPRMPEDDPVIVETWI